MDEEVVVAAGVGHWMDELILALMMRQLRMTPTMLELQFLLEARGCEGEQGV